jgi:hypothetical protein
MSTFVIDLGKVIDLGYFMKVLWQRVRHSAKVALLREGCVIAQRLHYYTICIVIA